MKTLLTLQAAVLMALSMVSIAAEVEYRHPNLTIVAKDEPLDSVLKSVSQEMRILVTTPTGLNPLVNCDIENQPIKLALKKLLGAMSYSLEWKDNGETLIGLTILTGTHDAVSNTTSIRKTNARYMDQADALLSTEKSSDAAKMPEYDSGMWAEQEEREARMEAAREEQEAGMTEQRAAREAEIVVRREEAVKAHEARVAEEVVRNEADMAQYFESQSAYPGH